MRSSRLLMITAALSHLLMVTAWGAEACQTRPVIYTDAIVVAPGQTLKVELSWPEKTIDNAFVRWDAVGPSDLCAIIIRNAATSSFSLVVPDVSPGPFGIVAFVRATDGSTAMASEELELLDRESYDFLQAVPSRLNMTGLMPQPLNIYGVCRGGRRRNLTASKRLEIVSSDVSMVGVVSSGMVQATRPGSAMLVAVFDDSLVVEIPVTIRGAVVEVVICGLGTPPSVDRSRRKPIRLAFLSSPGFKPQRLLEQTVRITNTPPLPFDDGALTQLSDINDDGELDLCVQTSPSTLDLHSGTIEIPISAVLHGGGFVAGKAIAQVVDPADINDTAVSKARSAIPQISVHDEGLLSIISRRAFAAMVHGFWEISGNLPKDEARTQQIHSSTNRNEMRMPAKPECVNIRVDTKDQVIAE